MPLWVGSRCWTMTKAMPHPSGTCFKNSSSASSPPAEAPMPTMGNTFCVLGSCSSGDMGTTDPFFRIFRPDGFFMVAIPLRSTAAACVPLLARLAFFDIDQPENHSIPTEFIKVAHPSFTFISHISFRKNNLMPFAVFLRHFWITERTLKYLEVHIWVDFVPDSQPILIPENLAPLVR